MKLQFTGSIEEILASIEDKHVVARIKDKLIGVFQAALTEEGIEQAVNDRVKTAVERRVREQLQLALDEAITVESSPGSRTGYRVTGWASTKLRNSIEQASELRHNIRLLIAQDVTETIKELMPTIQNAILYEAVSNRIDQVITSRLMEVSIENVIERTVRKVLAGK